MPEKVELEPVRRRDDEPTPFSVWLDGEGYSVEDRHHNVTAYFGLDCSGEGDYREWNRRQQRLAHFLADALNNEAWGGVEIINANHHEP